MIENVLSGLRFYVANIHHFFCSHNSSGELTYYLRRINVLRSIRQMVFQIPTLIVRSSMFS